MELYKRIAQTQNQLIKYDRLNSHHKTLDELNNLLPSGSGVDVGCNINITKHNKIVILSGWHIMNDGGYYDGWIDFRVVVTPSFDNFDLNIIGNFGKHQDLKDYLYELFNYSLNQEIN